MVLAPRDLAGVRDRVTRSAPQLLVLSHRVPWPPHNGAAIRTYGLLTALAEAYELTMLCFDRVDSALKRMPAAERLAKLRTLGHAEAVEIGQQGSRVRFALATPSSRSLSPCVRS